MKNKGRTLFLLLLLMAAAVVAAGKLWPSKLGAISTTEAKEFLYDLSKPEVVRLPQGLSEISGITYNAGQDALLAIEDETGTLYSIALTKNYPITQLKFAAKGDYEDLALIGNKVFILRSSGDIIHFDLSSPQKTNTFSFPRKGGAEFESLAYNPESKKLWLLCKHCKGNERAWEVDPQTGTFLPMKMAIKGKMAGLKKGDLKASGAAVHPLSGDLYLVSSINKLLVIVGREGQVKGSQKLDPRLFTQPEGICFSPSGELFIANEQNTSASATILRLKPNKEGRILANKPSGAVQE